MSAINVNPVSSLCQSCTGSISEGQKSFKVKKCGHIFHEPCLLKDGAAHIKVGKKFTQIFCPEKDCNQLIAKATKENITEKLLGNIEVIAPREALATAKKSEERPIEVKKNQERLIENAFRPKKNTKTLKAVTYIAVAMSVMLISVALFPSILGLGVGFLSSIPLAYLAGRVLDKVIIGN